MIKTFSLNIYILMGSFLISFCCFCQQSTSLSKYYAVKSKTVSDSGQESVLKNSNIKRFGIIGIGNLNTESFQNINSSGKFNCYIRPVVFGKKSNSDLTINLAYNKNATNSDTLLPTTILFPEIGSASFTGGLESSIYLAGDKVNKGVSHFISSFLEFAHKNIKAEKNNEEKFFSLLHYTVGARYIYRYSFFNDDELESVAFAFTPYFSIYNIPDEDNLDYRFLMGNNNLPSHFTAWGIKLTFQYKGFQIFSDFRHVLGDENKIAVRELRGFNSNIGVTFNAEIVEK